MKLVAGGTSPVLADTPELPEDDNKNEYRVIEFSTSPLLSGLVCGAAITSTHLVK